MGNYCVSAAFCQSYHDSIASAEAQAKSLSVLRPTPVFLYYVDDTGNYSLCGYWTGCQYVKQNRFLGGFGND